MSSYKEIVTKAVVGKGKKSIKGDYTIQTEEVPNTVLGCWVINHSFKGSKNKSDVIVDGKFDINVWYSYNDDTSTTVCTRTFSYSDIMNMKLDSLDINNEDIIIKALKQPTVVDVKIEDGLIKLVIEKELGVEVVGDTKVKIAALDTEDDYDELLDLDNDPELDNLTDDYIN